MKARRQKGSWYSPGRILHHHEREKKAKNIRRRKSAQIRVETHAEEFEEERENGGEKGF